MPEIVARLTVPEYCYNEVNDSCRYLDHTLTLCKVYDTKLDLVFESDKPIVKPCSDCIKERNVQACLKYLQSATDTTKTAGQTK